jgi:hypothetical protein
MKKLHSYEETKSLAVLIPAPRHVVAPWDNGKKFKIY